MASDAPREYTAEEKACVRGVVLAVDQALTPYMTGQIPTPLWAVIAAVQRYMTATLLMALATVPPVLREERAAAWLEGLESRVWDEVERLEEEAEDAL